MPADSTVRLRSARLGHVLMETVPGSALEIGRVHGPAVVVGPVGYPGAEVLPCQHRGALAQGIQGGTMAGYLCALGLGGVGGAVYLRLLLPPGADLGTGVVAVEEPPNRRLVLATTLGADEAIAAAHAGQSVPQPAGPTSARPTLADLRVEARHDPVLQATVVSWTHRPHPAAVAPVDDAVRAAAAACVVEELLQSLSAD
jgi:hypothetical protein